MTTEVKTQLTVANENAQRMLDTLTENEFYNFELIEGDFWTSFVFTNLSEHELEMIEVFENTFFEN